MLPKWYDNPHIALCHASLGEFALQVESYVKYR